MSFRIEFHLPVIGNRLQQEPWGKNNTLLPSPAAKTYNKNSLTYFADHVKSLFLFYYLLFKYLNPISACSARINAKEREKNEGKVRRVKKRKGIEAQRGKRPTPSRALMGEEEQNGKRKRTKRKKQGAGLHPSYQDKPDPGRIPDTFT